MLVISFGSRRGCEEGEGFVNVFILPRDASQWGNLLEFGVWWGWVFTLTSDNEKNNAWVIGFVQFLGSWFLCGYVCEEETQNRGVDLLPRYTVLDAVILKDSTKRRPIYDIVLGKKYMTSCIQSQTRTIRATKTKF